MTGTRRSFLGAMAGVGAAATVPATVALAAASPAPAGRQVPLMSTYVAGTDRYEAPAIDGGLSGGAELVLRREPDNAYDARAVSVWTEGGRKLGYVPRIHNQAIAHLMDAGLATIAQVDRVTGNAGRPDIALAVTVVLPA